MKKYLKKNYNWLWISAVLSYLLGMILGIVFEKEISIQDNPILEQISSLNGWLFLITAVVIAPILEEFSFRSWAINKKWTKYLSLVASSAFLFFINPYISIVYFLAFLLVVLLLKNKPKTMLISLAIISSLGFVLAHSENLELSVYIISIPTYLSIALLLSFVAIRFKFRYAILTHSIYNFSLFLIGGFIIPFGDTITLNEGNYKGTLTPISGLTSQYTTNNYGGYGANINRKMLPEIVSMLYFDSPYTIKTYPMFYSFYNLKVKTNDTLNRIDLHQLNQEIIRKTNIKIDTILEEKEVYNIEIVDLKKFEQNIIDTAIEYDIKKHLYLKYLLKTISNHYEIPLNIDEKYYDIKLRDNNKFLYFNNQSTLKKTIKDLEKYYGISLKLKKSKVKTIRIFEK
ncbi:MAG: CPBP family intramembrane glutamic endopeptidase [Bacteroidales bacterium]